ncbi:mitochondrial coenzyme A transporter SLC25A42-like [Hyposmocoma kahamanoa]|uniref:mitochondrial coenzyme A transporter SLC25A42-like n=1 Tax=Hyposmocoma kahamanoa TaxID=1477025 RepID=UPI000E6D9C76|nr:mitochondrial coenzyme A transporter SLC25A42-like [Hyposmocoma kahamanoa]
MAVRQTRMALMHDDKPAHAPLEPSSKPPTHKEDHNHTSLSPAATVVTSLISGALAGAIAKTAIAPLDRTKINFQTSQTPYSWRAATQFLLNSARSEGVIALWRGNSATMARIVPYAAIQFTAHEQWKKLLHVDTPQQAKSAPIYHLIAGSLAGVTSQSATYPLDLARARMAVTSSSQYRTLAAVFVKVIRKEGIRTLYRYHLLHTIMTGKVAGIRKFGRRTSWLRNIREWTGIQTVEQLFRLALDKERSRKLTADLQ